MIYLKNTPLKLPYLFVIATVILTTHCAPLPKDNEATILNYEYTRDGRGGYFYSFETSNGIKRKETGELLYEGLPDEHIFVKGSYSYIDTEGKEVTVIYNAGQEGYNILTEPDLGVPYSEPSPAVLATLLG